MKKFTIVYGFDGQKIAAKSVISAHNLTKAIDLVNEDYSYYDHITIKDDKEAILAEYANEAWQF